MKRWMLVAALVLGVQATAWADGDMYMPLVCRDDDPFVFCDQGCKNNNGGNQDYAWAPVSPPVAAWRPRVEEWWCPAPLTGSCCFGWVCFRPWSQTALTAWGQYLIVCPAAHETGDWEGSGRPESSPYDH